MSIFICFKAINFDQEKHPYSLLKEQHEVSLFSSGCRLRWTPWSLPYTCLRVKDSTQNWRVFGPSEFVSSPVIFFFLELSSNFSPALHSYPLHWPFKPSKPRLSALISHIPVLCRPEPFLRQKATQRNLTQFNFLISWFNFLPVSI